MAIGTPRFAIGPGAKVPRSAFAAMIGSKHSVQLAGGKIMATIPRRIPRRIWAPAAALGAALLLGGCAAAVLGTGSGTAAGGGAAAGGATTTESLKTAATTSATQTAATEGAKAAIEDRSAADQATDLRISTEIAADVLGESAGLFLDVSADVWEQRVMLTGSVEEAADKAKAAELVAAIDGVKQVINEIQVTAEGGGVGGFVDDTVIATKVEANLLTASGVSSLNYRWRSVNGHVYLIGRALSTAEHDKVKRLVGEINDVREVVSHVEVRPKESG